jgi:hypothetical protein
MRRQDKRKNIEEANKKLLGENFLPSDQKDMYDLPVWKTLLMKIQGVDDRQLQYNLDNDLPLNWKGTKEAFYEKMEPRNDYPGSN